MTLGRHYAQRMNSHLCPLLVAFCGLLGVFMYLPFFHPKSLSGSIYRAALLVPCESWPRERGEVARVRACVWCH
jgi:hypothetical protein